MIAESRIVDRDWCPGITVRVVTRACVISSAGSVHGLRCGRDRELTQRRVALLWLYLPQFPIRNYRDSLISTSYSAITEMAESHPPAKGRGVDTSLYSRVSIVILYRGWFTSLGLANNLPCVTTSSSYILCQSVDLSIRVYSKQTFR